MSSLVTSGVAVLAACDYQPAAPPTTATATTPTAASDAADDASAPAVTWQRDLRPVVEQRCNGCHTPGGVASITFEDVDEVVRMGPIIVGKVESGEMPPWPMDPDCRDIRDARVLPEAERALFAAWADAGYAAGDAADYVAPDVTPPAVAIGAHGMALARTDGYPPDVSVDDDYRCFLFPQAVEADTWIRGVRITPDEVPLVHHVLLFMIPPEAVAEAVALDAATPDVGGYPCQGGSGVAGDTMVAGWVPGSQPTLFPERAAIAAPAGARFVMQMHYNTINADRSRAIPEDTTGGWLELLPSGEDPSHVITIRPVLDPILAIQPGDAAAVEGASYPVRWDGQVVGVAPHMHTRGASVRVSLAHDGGGETCLADIPTWDFHWQQTYIYEPGDYVTLARTDTIRLECIYDNSGDADPQLVTWGEGTNDEMCLSYVVVMAPYVDDPTPGGVCASFAPCYAACAAGDALCAVQCLAADGTACTTCGADSLFGTCAAAECPSEADALAGCLEGCGGNKLQCAATTCKGASNTLYTCLEGPLRAGACDGPCGIDIAP